MDGGDDVTQQNIRQPASQPSIRPFPRSHSFFPMTALSSLKSHGLGTASKWQPFDVRSFKPWTGRGSISSHSPLLCEPLYFPTTPILGLRDGTGELPGKACGSVARASPGGRSAYAAARGRSGLPAPAVPTCSRKCPTRRRSRLTSGKLWAKQSRLPWRRRRRRLRWVH